jgi:hypothetical protein
MPRLKLTNFSHLLVDTPPPYGRSVCARLPFVDSREGSTVEVNTWLER